MAKKKTENPAAKDRPRTIAGTLICTGSNLSTPLQVHEPCKPAVFCRHVPNLYGTREHFKEVTECPLMLWAEQHVEQFDGFYYVAPVTEYCRQFEGYLPRCPLLEYVFDSHNKDDLFEKIVRPPFEPTPDIDGLIKLLDWFIQIDTTKPSNLAGPLEQSLYFYFWYRTCACVGLLRESGILSLLSCLHNQFETSYHNQAFLDIAKDLKVYAEKLISAAFLADNDFGKDREQNRTPKRTNMVTLRLQAVQQAAANMRLRLLYIQRDLLEHPQPKADDKNNQGAIWDRFTILEQQVLFDNQDMNISGGKCEILKKLIELKGGIAKHEILSGLTARYQQYISEMKKSWPKFCPCWIKAVSGEGYKLLPQKPEKTTK